MRKCCKYWLSSQSGYLRPILRHISQTFFPKSHILLALPKTVMGLKENRLYPGKGAEPGATARKTASSSTPPQTSLAAKNKHGPAKSISVIGAAATKLIQRKRVNPQENGVRHFVVVPYNNLSKYLQCDQLSTLRTRHCDCCRRRHRHFRHSVTGA